MKPKPYRPDLFFLMDPKLELVVGVEAVEPRASMQEAARWVETTIADHPTLPVRLSPPKRLRADGEALAEVLRGRFAGQIDVITGATPEIDAALADLAAHAAPTRSPRACPSTETRRRRGTRSRASSRRQPPCTASNRGRRPTTARSFASRPRVSSGRTDASV
jgi:hypothetical protein